MVLSFHDISLAVYAQTLSAVLAVLDKGAAHFAATGIDPDEITNFSLAPDMKPFRFQIQSVSHHSLGAVAALRSGSFSPPPPTPDWRWRDLPGVIDEARAVIEAVSPDELDDLSDRQVLFTAPGRQRLFTAVEFVLSWSTPNLHFHAATAYDILRHKGVALNKSDFLGQLRGYDPRAAV